MGAFNRAARRATYRQCEELSTGSDSEGGWREVETGVQEREGEALKFGIKTGGEESPLVRKKMFINQSRQATTGAE